MADFNRNSNGVFGEIKLNGNSNDTENTSFFEGTMVSGINIQLLIYKTMVLKTMLMKLQEEYLEVSKQHKITKIMD